MYIESFVFFTHNPGNQSQYFLDRNLFREILASCRSNKNQGLKRRFINTYFQFRLYYYTVMYLRNFNTWYKSSYPHFMQLYSEYLVSIGQQC